MARLALLLASVLRRPARSTAAVPTAPGSSRPDLDSGEVRVQHHSLILRDSAGAETYSFARGELITFELDRSQPHRPAGHGRRCPRRPRRDFVVVIIADRQNLAALALAMTGRSSRRSSADLLSSPMKPRRLPLDWTQVRCRRHVARPRAVTRPAASLAIRRILRPIRWPRTRTGLEFASLHRALNGLQPGGAPASY